MSAGSFRFFGGWLELEPAAAPDSRAAKNPAVSVSVQQHRRVLRPGRVLRGLGRHQSTEGGVHIGRRLLAARATRQSSMEEKEQREGLGREGTAGRRLEMKGSTPQGQHTCPSCFLI